MGGGPALGPPVVYGQRCRVCCAKSPKTERGGAGQHHPDLFVPRLGPLFEFFEVTGPVRASIAAAQCYNKNAASRDRTRPKKNSFFGTFLFVAAFTLVFGASFSGIAPLSLSAVNAGYLDFRP